jgi:two-component system CheB/CheR fusion protein
MSDETQAIQSSDSSHQETGTQNAAPATQPDDMIIAGIGASAGGLDSLKKVLPSLPCNAGIAYVIVQHLSPKHQTLLPSLLAKYTDMPIKTIGDGMRVEPDTIHVTPPNKDVKFTRDGLKLMAASHIGPKPSIDYFFTSLAEGKQTHAVGIILSGSGTDGAHGIRAIKSNDGITMAQSVNTAKFFSMPQAAIDTGLVDLVTTPENIGRELESALKYPKLLAKGSIDSDTNEVTTILGLLLQETGVDFSQYKKATILRRIGRRMVVNKIGDLQKYAAYIQQHPKEVVILHKDLLISVTSFFRDPHAFVSLEQKLRRLFERKPDGGTFRAWVPGCSTGEEAYSIAILVSEILGKDLNKHRIHIFATDVDEDSVQIARKNKYPLATIMDTDGRRFGEHFSQFDSAVAVNKRIRDMVVLARQDVIKDTPFLHLDLISCRNLMIYMNAELQDQLLSLFHFSLNPEGLLLLGKSESIDQRTDLFETLDHRWKIYQRKEVPSRKVPALLMNNHSHQLAQPRTVPLVQRNKQGDRRESVFFDALLDTLGCGAALTDDHGNIIYLRGELSPYLQLQEGTVQGKPNAIDMAQPKIRLILQSLFLRCRKENCSAASKAIACGQDNKGVRITVGPVENKDAERCRLIVFTPVELPMSEQPCESPLAPGDSDRILELEQELDATREYLQFTIEELETATEELQSLNEEMQSANEELHASNEELETSNEELQASNEELNTVNDELRAKSEEVSHLLSNLQISERRYRLLVDNMNEALVLCELTYGRDSRPTDLIISQANRASRRLFHLNGDKLPSRAVSANLQEMAKPDLLQRFKEITKGTGPQLFDLRFETLGKDLALSVYHMEEERLGVVFRDDTERNQMEAALKKLNASLERQVAERTKLAEARARDLQNLSVELIEAEERERQRVAELLHDDLQQLLATARLQLQAASADLAFKSELAGVEKLLVTSIQKTRQLSHELSPPVLHHTGLVDALKWLVRQMEAQFGLQVALESADIERRFEESAPKMFLFRAVQEFLFNVVKHAGVDSARVVLADTGEDVVIKVCDHGRGFNPATVSSYTGTTGYGLLSLKERSSHMGCRMEIESAPGKGCRITLSVPHALFAKSPSDKIRPRLLRRGGKRTVRKSSEDSTGLRVLIVDDHTVMRKGLIQLIAGHSDINVVAEASNGKEALEKAIELNPDVVVLDVSMPEMDGVEAAGRIKSELPAVRIVGLSMFEDEHIGEAMRAAGASTFVSKTASSAELLKAIYGLDDELQN